MISKFIRFGAQTFSFLRPSTFLLKRTGLIVFSSYAIWKSRKTLWMKSYDKKAYNDFL